MAAAAQEPYTVDWRKQQRRPFKRGFIPYEEEEANIAESKSRREQCGIEIVEDPAGEEATPSPIDSYEALSVLPDWLQEVLVDKSKELTPLQAQALPIVLAGQNLVAVGRANSGQNLACLVPAIVHMEDQKPLDSDEPGPIALVLVPSQEAAAKFAQEANALLKLSSKSLKHKNGLRCVNVSGGGTRSEKLKELGDNGAHLVVGTPKRIHDMACKCQLNLMRVTYLVFESADKMIDLGFLTELQDIGNWIRPERHTLVLAGTWPRSMSELSSQVCFAGGSPVHINVNAGAPKTVPKRPASKIDEPAFKVAKLVPKPKALAAKAADEDFPEDW